MLAGVYCEETARSILECSISDAEILAECTHSNDLILQCNGNTEQRQNCNLVSLHIILLASL